MHGYSVDGHDRQVVHGVLATLSVAAALFLDSALKRLGWAVPWWVDSPSVMGFFGFLHRAYELHGWRVFRSTPDFRGTWVGWADSTHANGTRSPVVLHIRQTWTRISICLESETSVSRSLMAAVHTRDGSRPGVSYEYLNEPKARTVSTLHIHRGTVALRLGAAPDELEGDYYTGRDRSNVGTLAIRRVSYEFVPHAEALLRVTESANPAGGT
jgi:hypothetical protein